MKTTPALRLGLGLGIGLAGLIGMVSLVGGAFTGGMTVLAWIVVGLAMLGWVGYAGWRARHSRLSGRAAIAVLVLVVLGLGLTWIGVGGAVLALVCSLAAFVLVWVHDLPPRRIDNARLVRVDELDRDDTDDGESEDA